MNEFFSSFISIMMFSFSRLAERSSNAGLSTVTRCQTPFFWRDKGTGQDFSSRQIPPTSTGSKILKEGALFPTLASQRRDILTRSGKDYFLKAFTEIHLIVLIHRGLETIPPSIKNIIRSIKN